jgi:hypothetical protein
MSPLSSSVSSASSLMAPSWGLAGRYHWRLLGAILVLLIAAVS